MDPVGVGIGSVVGFLVVWVLRWLGLWLERDWGAVRAGPGGGMAPSLKKVGIRI